MNLFDELYELPFSETVVFFFGGEYPYAKIYTSDYGEIELPLEIINDGSYIEYYNSVIGERAMALKEYMENSCLDCKHFRSFESIYEDDLEPWEYGWCYQPDAEPYQSAGEGYVCELVAW